MVSTSRRSSCKDPIPPPSVGCKYGQTDSKTPLGIYRHRRPDPTRYVEPPTGKKDIGWDVGERPPAQYANWLQGTTGQWIDWLDTYEDTAHTWTATQTFTPSTAAPGVLLGYNSSTDTANETPSLAFQAGTTTQSVVDRLGLPSQRWLRREYMWWGAPSLTTVGGRRYRRPRHGRDEAMAAP